jgi:hypothetical protein
VRTPAISQSSEFLANSKAFSALNGTYLTDLMYRISLAKTPSAPRFLQLLVVCPVSLRLGVLCEMGKHNHIHGFRLK